MARSRALTVCVCRSVVAAAFSFCTGRQAGSLTSATVGVSTPGTRADSARWTDGRTDGRRQEHGSASLSWSPDGGRGSSPHAHVPHGRKRDEEGQRCGASPDREEMNKFPESPSHLCISSLRTTSRDREQLQGSLGRHVFRFPSL